MGMSRFVPSFAVLDERKLTWGLVAIAIASYLAGFGTPSDYWLFKLLVKLFGGIGFMYFTVYGVFRVLGEESYKKYSKYVFMVSTVFYYVLLDKVGWGLI